MVVGHLPRSFTALRHKGYRRYWLSQSFSLIGSWMQVTAQSWLVFDLVADPAEAAIKFGYISAVQFAPVLVLGLFAGVVIDARPKRSVLLASQGTLAFSALALAVLTLTGTLTYPLLLAVAVLNGVANAFDLPTRQSLVPDLVPKEDVRNAVALNSLAFNAARLVGPAVAAATIAAFGQVLAGGPLLRYGPAFALNALSYGAVIAAVLTIPLPAHVIKPHRVVQEIREGILYTFRTPEVRLATLLVGSLSLTIVNFQMIVPLFARQALGLTVGGLGLLLSSLGVGAILAFVVNSRYADDARLVLMRWGTLLLAVCFIAFTLTSTLWLAAVALVGCGLGMILTMVNAQATVQLMVPDGLRGRVMSVYMLVFSGLTPFGALLVSQLVSRLGPRTGLLMVGLLGLFAVLGLRPHRRDLRRAREHMVNPAGTD